jgi:hypothetical protein
LDSINSPAQSGNAKTLKIVSIYGNDPKMENTSVVNSDLDKDSNFNGENFKVFIINRYPPLTSPYRWSQDLSSIFEKNSVQ